MRVTSEFWTSALIRRVFSEGGFGTVVRRGVAEAGAIFVLVRGRAGEVRLFGPAPQTSYGSGRPEERAFALLPVSSEEEADARLKREERFDPDFWVVEIEPGRTPVEDLLAVTPA